jgi:D-arabinose 1-dehydrogenase-like Zn-dependent alcohol dehydrogenase
MEGGMGVLLSQLGVRSPGHEGAGVVVQVGASVDGKEWKVGDRVGIKPVWDACMNCDRCWALCLRLGCEHFLDFKEVENVEMEVMKLTGGEGAHAVLVTTGSASAYKSAPSMVRPGGKIMCVGLREYFQRLPWGLLKNRG